MNFFSITFLIFLIIVFSVYYLMPSKCRTGWLLLSSYFFYASWNLKYVLVLLLITGISYFIPLKMNKNNKKLLLGAGITVTLLTLVVFKFWKFWALGISLLFGKNDALAVGIENIIAPIGLSFYVLEAIGYMVDVYREKFVAEKNIVKYSLFLCFFPNVISGPIERGYNLIPQFDREVQFDYIKVKKGLLMILWGYFMKIMIANKLQIIVDEVYKNYDKKMGIILVIAVILYGIQLYADFAGYSFIALGIARTLGFELMQNFRQPYFSQSINEFWNRWHISLSSWLKDYVYIPLGGNRKGKARQCINLFITFLISGIWHGTGWQFVIWGMLHGLYQVIAKLFLAKKNNDNNGIIKKVYKSVMTFIIVDFAWLFFRASSVNEGLEIIKCIIKRFGLSNIDLYSLFPSKYNGQQIKIFVGMLLVTLIIMLIVDVLHEKKISISEWIRGRHLIIRWCVYLAAAVILIIGAIYDYGGDASTFIYTKF